MKDIRQEFWENPSVIKSFSEKLPSSYITNVLDEFIANVSFLKVLDIGCGTGRYSKYLKNRGVDVIALDKHKGMIQSLQDDKIPFILANMSTIPLPANTFDLILSIGVLHNAISMNELQSSISEMSRLLKSNGFLLCSIFTDDLISEDLTVLGDGIFLILNQLPMILLPRDGIDELFLKRNLRKHSIIDEHITDVGTGKRYVYTALFQKK